MTTAEAFGWVLYVIIILYAISGSIYVWTAARSRGPVTQMGLFQWVFSLGCVLVFGLVAIHKLHLLWVIPLGFLISFTPLGRAIGETVGHLTALAFSTEESGTSQVTPEPPQIDDLGGYVGWYVRHSEEFAHIRLAQIRAAGNADAWSEVLSRHAVNELGAYTDPDALFHRITELDLSYKEKLLPVASQFLDLADAPDDLRNAVAIFVVRINVGLEVLDKKYHYLPAKSLRRL